MPRLDGFKIDVEGACGAAGRRDGQPCGAKQRWRRRTDGGRAATAAIGLQKLLLLLLPPAPSEPPTTCFLTLGAGIKLAVAEHQPKIVFLTSPNNPDGSMLSTEELLEILELPVLVGCWMVGWVGAS